jgi:type II secretory pathway pseudopilin PulG
MLRLEAGKTDEAWQDVMACHRLARLVGQGPTIIECLVGIAIEGTACQADAAMAHHGGLSSERAGRFAEELKQLPPMPKMVDKIVTGERFMFLDAVSMMARRGPAEMGRLAGGSAEAKGFAASLANAAANAAINWDEPMRMGNEWYDRYAAAFAKPTRAERDAALREIEKDVKQMAQQARDVTSFLGEFLTYSPRRTMGRQMGRMFAALLLPAISAVAKAEDRGVAYSSLGQVALALAAYRAEHGTYPTQLAQLSPKYLAAIPEDPFADGPLRYKRTKTGCVVYSIGPNGKDDGGASRSLSSDDDASVPPDADDVAIAMPWPKKKQ